jgi:DNA-binding transcriptional LysR family regulator
MPPPKLKERQIEVFRAVMAAGSLSAAARQLGVSQPSLSMTIRRLEDEIGTKLFERIAGRLAPTEEAKLIFVEVDRVYGQFDRLSEAVHAIATGDQSVFRFGTTPSIGMRMIPKALKRLKDRHPQRVYYCDYLAQKDIRDYLLFGRGACVATIAETQDPTVESVVIARGRLVCLLPQDHRLAGETAIAPYQLQGESLISFAAHTPHGRLIDETYRRAGVTRETSVFVHFVEAAIGFVSEGIGVAIVDEFSAIDCQQAGLRSVPLENSVKVLAYVQWHKHRPRARAADELIDALIAVAPEVKGP